MVHCTLPTIWYIVRVTLPTIWHIVRVTLFLKQWLIYFFLQLQRQYKAADTERNEANDKLTELQGQKNGLQASKRKAEQQLTALQEEYEEMETESRENADKLRKATEQVPTKRYCVHKYYTCFLYF